MTNKQDLNKIKRELFKDLANKVRTISANQETAIFSRKMNFGKTPVYFEYSFKDNAINQIYLNKGRGKKKIFYDKNQNPGLQELNKYFENKK